MTASSPLLEVDALTARFRVDGHWLTAVDRLTFSLALGETLAIVGESGSGKSVTALSIMRLLAIANGRIDGSVRLDGRELLTLTEEEMRQVRGNEIAMIFQEPMTSLNPVLTIGFQIVEALRQHRPLDAAAAKAEALRILDRVRIPDARQRFDEYPHRFSGGMRQRVMIAMALSCQPRILIADEPTTALDVTIQAEILELIKSLQAEEGMSVLFITHDMGVVAEIADRVLVMLKGEKVEEDTAAIVLEHPRHPYTRALIAAVPTLGTMRGKSSPERLARSTLDPAASPVQRLAPSRSDESRPLLDVRNLTTRFDVRGGLFRRVTGRVHAVEGVTFSLSAGETLSLVGESGCGKSTLGRSLLRLVEPAAGTIEFEGQDVRSLDRRQLKEMRCRMQMIFQDPYGSLNPRRTVGAAIAEPIFVHRLRDKSEVDDRVADLLRKVGLSPDMAPRFPHEFSGGQRQRLCIARALAVEPKLLVADESVSALDVSVKAQVLNLLMDLQDELGLAFLFISHDIAVVERISHRVAVMYLGEIVEVGPRAAVLENPQHPYTRRLIEAVPRVDPSRRQLRRPLATEEIASSVQRRDYQVPTRHWRTVEPGHLVQVAA